MSAVDPETLPESLDPEGAVEAAYGPILTELAGTLARQLPVLIDCEKEIVPYLYMAIRDRLRQRNIRAVYLDGRPNRGESSPPLGGGGFVQNLIEGLRDAVGGAVERRVVVLPHLDLMTTSTGGLTTEAREIIPLLYENPELVWLGFRDPSFPIPAVIENLFPRRQTILGVPRDRLTRLVTRGEARKFGVEFVPHQIYKYVSGMNAVRLRRVLATLEGEDYPASPRKAYAQLRTATVGGSFEIPAVDLTKDIGGYAHVKNRLTAEILEILRLKERRTSEEEIRKLERLIPRGMIFWGPPGTGKTLFAKAVATALGAAIQVVSGPELKSRWVGESEENLRRLFHQARRSAPSIIVFDELDSFASRRGTYTGSGVEHSMVNQLLTEMDGFRSDELVFVIGTTNFPESLDPALLRPGRFEFHLHIPHPDAEDRRQILAIYDQAFGLNLTPEALDYAVKKTGETVEGAPPGTFYTGDHLNALCRAMARIRLREDRTDPTDRALIDRAMTEWLERPVLSADEEAVVAVHESGHAICALACDHAPAIERISIRADTAGALGFVRYHDPARRFVITRRELLDHLTILMGGRAAERVLLDDLSVGSAGDLDRATAIARALVEEFGLGEDDAVGPVRYRRAEESRRPEPLSPEQAAAIDRRVRELLIEAEKRAIAIVTDRRGAVEALRDLLLDAKVIEADTLQSFMSPGTT